MALRQDLAITSHAAASGPVRRAASTSAATALSVQYRARKYGFSGRSQSHAFATIRIFSLGPIAGEASKTGRDAMRRVCPLAHAGRTDAQLPYTDGSQCRVEVPAPEDPQEASKRGCLGWARTSWMVSPAS